VLFPSSTFVEDLPSGFAEYVAAKLAGEQLCRAWQSVRPDQRVVVERFPPLVTDQTAARLGSDAATNLDVLVPVLRRLGAT
jgi:nucleoside-diphosphate-sugar epimerase